MRGSRGRGPASLRIEQTYRVRCFVHLLRERRLFDGDERKAALCGVEMELNEAAAMEHACFVLAVFSGCFESAWVRVRGVVG